MLRGPRPSPHGSEGPGLTQNSPRGPGGHPTLTQRAQGSPHTRQRAQTFPTLPHRAQGSPHIRPEGPGLAPHTPGRPRPCPKDPCELGLPEAWDPPNTSCRCQVTNMDRVSFPSHVKALDYVCLFFKRGLPTGHRSKPSCSMGDGAHERQRAGGECTAHGDRPLGDVGTAPAPGTHSAHQDVGTLRVHGPPPSMGLQPGVGVFHSRASPDPPEASGGDLQGRSLGHTGTLPRIRLETRLTGLCLAPAFNASPAGSDRERGAHGGRTGRRRCTPTGNSREASTVLPRARSVGGRNAARLVRQEQ